MRLGLVGLGRIGAFHAETLRGLPQVSALVVHDVNEDAVTAQAEHDGEPDQRDGAHASPRSASRAR